MKTNEEIIKDKELINFLKKLILPSLYLQLPHPNKNIQIQQIKQLSEEVVEINKLIEDYIDALEIQHRPPRPPAEHYIKNNNKQIEIYKGKINELQLANIQLSKEI